MTTLKARFDGKVLIPEGPVDLPTDCVLEVEVRTSSSATDEKPPLQRLAELAKRFPADSATPADAAAQHDHYLYGLPKKP
jgi:hypothetical protein